MADPAIDLQHLDKYAAGDRGLLEEILKIFMEHAALCADKLDPAGPDEDWRNACHALKGAARGVGAWRLGDFAADAEGLIGDLPDLQKVRARAAEDIRAECAHARAFAADVIDRAPRAAR